MPFLLGLDVSTKFKIILDFGEDVTKSKCDEWTLPITRKMGHAYVERTPSSLYTERELRQVHRSFFHPQMDRLTNLIKRSDCDADISQLYMYANIEKIKATCDVCSRRLIFDLDFASHFKMMTVF